jgi:hypothetical protein
MWSLISGSKIINNTGDGFMENVSGSIFKECAKSILLENVDKHTIQLVWFLNNDSRLVE